MQLGASTFQCCDWLLAHTVWASLLSPYVTNLHNLKQTVKNSVFKQCITYLFL